MKKNFLLIFVLLLSILGATISCEKSEEAVSRRLRSYKTQYLLQGIGQGGGTSILEYDGQQRLTAWNNDSVRWHYAYRTNGDIDVYGESLRDGSRQFTCISTLNEAGLPDMEKFSLLIVPLPVETPVLQVVTYVYDEKNRLVHNTEKADAGDFSYLVNFSFFYEGTDDNVTRMRYEWEGKDDAFSYYYDFEYLDQVNPVDFYPELLITTTMVGGYHLIGKAGYKRSKLLKRMSLCYEENVMSEAIDFHYDYDADGNITECTLTWRMMNADGVLEGDEFIRFYDIKY